MNRLKYLNLRGNKINDIQDEALQVNIFHVLIYMFCLKQSN